MTATSVKNEAKRLVENLPETASWDDLMYEVYVRQKIEEGVKAADEGRVLTHEEVRKRFGMQ
jgi:predicted transcriptional regulator